MPVIWIVGIDILAWAIFHLSISAVCLRIPVEFFLNDDFWFQIFPWEDSGELWSRWLRVKRWKGSLVDGSVLFKRGYRKKELPGTNTNTLKIFAAETKRAELTHWLSILPAPLFFLWNPVWVGWLMVVYAFVFNLPFIVVQRYNRSRIAVITARQMLRK